MAKEYNISRATGFCHACERKFEPGDGFTATVRQNEDDFLREDYCHECYAALDDARRNDPGVWGVWRTRVPQPKEKKKVFVDDEVLMNFFHRLAEDEDEAKIGFRFVLTLVLMRKKILSYEGMNTDKQGRDLWKMRIRGEQRIHNVIDPHLDEETIAEVTGQLGAILEGDLQ
ncbi:MAG: hypothetical protein ACLFV7_03805 [Phycisphaerae bacterium]